MQVVEATRNDPVQVLPSEWVKFAFDMPRKGKLQSFSFRKREYLIPIYDRPDRHILLMFGRQSEKSTTLGNKLLALMALLPYYKVLYVSPSQTQTRKFSQDRIAQPLIVSPRLRELVGTIAPDNIHQKVFVRNQSSIELRYAFLNPDRVRGVPADHLVVDELQDVFIDSVPVLEETLSASDRPTHAGWKTMAGTPKSLDNTMAHYWSLSTQSELVIPCERHGETNRPGTWHWIVAGEDNIGKKGMICEKCGNLVDRYHPLRGWVDTVSGAKIRGYRLPQILAPYVKDSQWDEKIIYKYNSYGRAQFLNEVLAIPWEQGVRPITQGEVMSCCDPDWKMTREQMREALRWYTQREVFAGIDYGTGENSWTVIALGAYVQPTVFKIFYLHRFTGRETSTDMQTKLLLELLTRFNVLNSFGDYGIGYQQNDVLTRERGARRHHILQYAASAKRKIYYNPSKGRWIGERDDLMSAVLNAIKTRKIQFPSWDVFAPFGQDILNITAEFNEARQRTVFSHHPEKPDDSFHAILYCLMAASLVTPRPDIWMSVTRSENPTAWDWESARY